MFWGSVVSPHPFLCVGFEAAACRGSERGSSAPRAPRVGFAVGEHSLGTWSYPGVLVSSEPRRCLSLVTGTGPQAGGPGSVWRVASPAPPTGTVGAARTCRSSLPGRHIYHLCRSGHPRVQPRPRASCSPGPIPYPQLWCHWSPSLVGKGQAWGWWGGGHPGSSSALWPRTLQVAHVGTRSCGLCRF